jgi:hypothetical protein
MWGDGWRDSSEGRLDWARVATAPNVCPVRDELSARSEGCLAEQVEDKEEAGRKPDAASVLPRNRASSEALNQQRTIAVAQYCLPCAFSDQLPSTQTEVNGRKVALPTQNELQEGTGSERCTSTAQRRTASDRKRS